MQRLTCRAQRSVAQRAWVHAVIVYHTHWPMVHGASSESGSCGLVQEGGSCTESTTLLWWHWRLARGGVGSGA